MRPRLLLFLTLMTAMALPAALLAAGSARAYQHIPNGGFEDGADGWAVDGGTTLNISADAAFEGSAGAHLSGAGTMRLSHIIDDALAEGSYVLSARVRPIGADAEVTLRLAPDGWGPMQATTLALQGAWTDVSATFVVASASNASIRISIDADDAYVDEVRLEGAPPVTLAPTPTITAVPTVIGSELTPSASGTPVPSLTGTATPFADVITAHVRNPGFEETTAEGLPFAWEKYGGVLTSDGGGRTGLAARLESTTGSTKWLHQTVTVADGGWYAFGAWVLHDDVDVAAAFLRVSWYASADASGEALSTADSADPLSGPSPIYRQLSTGSVQAPSSARSARLRIMLTPHSDASALIAVDDVTWEPGSPVAPSATATRAAVIGGNGETTAGSTASQRTPRRSSVRAAHGTAATFIGAPSDARIVINEVLYDADGDAADSDLEWVELYNASDVDVDISGWALVDGVNVDELPSLVVPARGFTIVAASDAFFDEYPAFTGAIAVLNGRIGNGLGNEGDALFLLDPAGRAADAVSWGDNAFALNPAVDAVPEGHSIEREVADADSNVADDWIDNEAPSPGRPYQGHVVRANGGSSTIEIMEGAGGRSWDWLPWALVAASAVALCGSVGWRTFESVRARIRQPP